MKQDWTRLGSLPATGEESDGDVPYPHDPSCGRLVVIDFVRMPALEVPAVNVYGGRAPFVVGPMEVLVREHRLGAVRQVDKMDDVPFTVLFVDVEGVDGEHGVLRGVSQGEPSDQIVGVGHYVDVVIHVVLIRRAAVE